METNVQPSFIPKKALNQSLAKPPRTASFFSIIATVIFVTVLILAGAAYGYNYYLNTELAKKRDALQAELDNFKRELVDELGHLDSRIESAKMILNKHMALSSFFTVLGNATLKSVQFSNFNWSAPVGQTPTISMSGVTKSFASAALQQEEFRKPENLLYFSKPMLSDFSLGKDGKITFSFTSTVNPTLLSFGTILKGLQAPAVTTHSTTTPQ